VIARGTPRRNDRDPRRGPFLAELVLRRVLRCRHGYEILDGELFVTPAPAPRHQTVLANLVLVLEQYVRPRRLGRIFFSPIDLILAPTTIAQPDLLFVPSGKRAIVTGRGIEAAPDLVVEVVSPHSARQDRQTKAALYGRFGIPNYWILDPAERTFEAFALERTAYRLAVRGGEAGAVQAAPFSDLAIALGEIWDDRIP
jgi:Uma2 family endonuclease